MFAKRIDSFHWPFVDNETHKISWYNCYYVRNYYIVDYIVIIIPRYLEDYIENDEWKNCYQSEFTRNENFSCSFFLPIYVGWKEKS